MKYTKKEIEDLAKHNILENHEKGEFMSNIINNIITLKDKELSGNEIIQHITKYYVEFLENVENGSKKFARENLLNIFINEEYFKIHPLLK